MNSSPPRSYVRIFLRDYAAQLRVGMDLHEKFGPQTVIINLECELDGAPRFDDPTEKDLVRAVDYSAIHRFLAEELKTMPHIGLLESVAEIIATFCLRDPRVASVRIRLEKPAVMPGTAGAGVELFRVQENV